MITKMPASRRPDIHDAPRPSGNITAGAQPTGSVERGPNPVDPISHAANNVPIRPMKTPKNLGLAIRLARIRSNINQRREPGLQGRRAIMIGCFRSLPLILEEPSISMIQFHRLRQGTTKNRRHSGPRRNDANREVFRSSR
jgi:hypothetical protein